MKKPVIEVPEEDKEPAGEPYLSEHTIKSYPPHTITYLEEYRQEDIKQVREWKNRVIKIRDSYQGTSLFITWDLEARRVIEFLNKFN
ncbi:hypothetical protein [uncultured Clostridium sp.]|uniref:hypothetical protein n=1 Tax=uncultured Clostridium sp. TaxID=59620 RepID=UPI00262DC39F|nr:hypothetical protein [uncultured Clostridium sp.]